MGHQEELQKKQRACLRTDAKMSRIHSGAVRSHVSVGIGAVT